MSTTFVVLARTVARTVIDLPKLLLLALVRAYRLFFSPWLGGACRFTPTCSAYALEALQVHGAAVGSARAAWRVLRCGPWCEGGHDPVRRGSEVQGESAPSLPASVANGRPVPDPDSRPRVPSSSPATSGPPP